jgi:ABC transport system ATP-binding/permease protein
MIMSGTGTTTPPGLPLTLDGACVTVGGSRPKRILDDASVHIAPGQFVGILGSSGSGKSTLIKVLAGLNEISAGSVLVGGRGMTAEQLLHESGIAYMPQDVVIHEALTARRALGYVGRLKGLATESGGLRERIAKAAERVGLTDHLDVPIHRLSGGQRKRAGLAAELLGDPKVILLDEATSGLDPASEADMMRLFRSLADEGRTVICITHFPDRLALCDRLIYLMDGRVVFCGPPAELRAQFGTTSIEEVYIAQNEATADEWRQRFERSPAGTSHQVVQNAGLALATGTAENKPMPEISALSQFITLLRRYARVQLADWMNLLLLFGQAPVIGLMIGFTYGDIRADFAELHAARTKEVIFLLVIAVFWCAGTASVREIVKEKRILGHETRFGLRLPPYLLSKLSLLSFLTLAQTAILLLVVRNFTGLTGSFAPQFAVLALTSIVGLALGLLVSAGARSSEQAMTLLPVLLIMQAIFSGGLAGLSGVVGWFSRILISAWWSLDGLRSSFDASLTHATYPSAPGHFQPAVLGMGGPLWLDLGVLAAHCAAWIAICLLLLRKQRRGV